MPETDPKPGTPPPPAEKPKTETSDQMAAETIDFADEEPPFDMPFESPFPDNTAGETTVADSAPAVTPVKELPVNKEAGSAGSSFVTAASGPRLTPVSLEELEHVEDKRLDADFEWVMNAAGDDLRPTRSLIEELKLKFGTTDKSTEAAVPFSAEEAARSNRAVEIAWKLGSDDEEVSEMPVLPENPDEQDLIEYAKRHPSLRGILKLFKGQVVGARKK